jgi:hypothetical protein
MMNHSRSKSLLVMAPVQRSRCWWTGHSRREELKIVHSTESRLIRLARMIDKIQLRIHNSSKRHMGKVIQLNSTRGLKVHSNRETLKAQHSMRSIQLGMGCSSRSFGSLRSTSSRILMVMVLLVDNSYRSPRYSSIEELWVLHTIGCTSFGSLELIQMILLQHRR